MRLPLQVCIIFYAYLLASLSISAEVLPLQVAEKQIMEKTIWYPGCPVSLSQLRDAAVQYWGLDGRTHQGHLVVHTSVAKEIDDLFDRFYRAHIVFESIKPMQDFNGDDELAMSRNNTSSFNCRPITGASGKFSQHAYGLAVDINPRWNPYIKGSLILPKNAKAYDVDHCLEHQNCANNLVVKAFKDAGWTWGGDWHSLKDYQHFEKPMALK